MLSKKIILITGGTGSFGNVLVEKLIDSDLYEIRIFSRDEKKQTEMRQFYSNPKLKFYIGDIRDVTSIDSAMNGVDFVFHAAALKQVPSGEVFPLEAVKTNVIGSNNILESALKNEVKKVIILSTDRSVYPINVMGITKALSELLMISKSRDNYLSNTIFCATRYGNVIGSRGSVIPLLVEQIKKNVPLTITDPEMTRFMMTLEDAVSLVLYSLDKGGQGDRFVMKSKSTKISTLAIALKEIYNSKSDIRIIGTRHGEKKYESLLTREEMYIAEDLGNFFRIPFDNRDLNYNLYFSEGNSIDKDIQDYNSNNTHIMELEELKNLLISIDFIKNDFV